MARKESGFIYILQSQTDKSIIKVGLTRRDPINRLNEIHDDDHYINYALRLIHSVATSDIWKHEKAAHRKLKQYAIKDPGGAKELFKCTPEHALKVILDLSKKEGLEQASPEFMGLFDDLL